MNGYLHSYRLFSARNKVWAGHFHPGRVGTAEIRIDHLGTIRTVEAKFLQNAKLGQYIPFQIVMEETGEEVRIPPHELKNVGVLSRVITAGAPQSLVSCEMSGPMPFSGPPSFYMRERPRIMIAAKGLRTTMGNAAE